MAIPATILTHQNINSDSNMSVHQLHVEFKFPSIIIIWRYAISALYHIENVYLYVKHHLENQFSCSYID